MVLYYTGTGNSKYVAEKLADALGEETLNLFDRIRNKDYSVIHSDSPWIVVTPTYAWQIPHIVRDYLKLAALEGSKTVYFVLTCGDSVGNAVHYAEKIADAKGFFFKGLEKVVMPENYLAMFPTPNDAAARDTIEKASAQITRIADMINRGVAFEGSVSPLDRVLSSAANASFYAMGITDSNFVVTGICTSCGLCETLCPMMNISMDQGRPKWNGNCTHCMACICHCPVQAIEYGKKSVGRNRYTLEKALKK